MKKLIILLLVLMMAVFSVNAAAGTSDTGDTTITTSETKEWVENTDGGAKLTIKAYKKNKADGVLTVKVIDALTGSLDDIFNTTHVNESIVINNYVDKFLGVESDTTGIRKKAIFSVHVAGNRTGTFTVKVQFEPLAKYKKIEQDKYDSSNANHLTVKIDGKNTYWEKVLEGNSPVVIPITYYMWDINYFFTSAGSTKADTDEIKLSNSTTEKSYVSVDKSSGSLSFSWTVTGSSGNYWDIETMFAMIINESTYNNYKKSGTYMAPISIYITQG